MCDSLDHVQDIWGFIPVTPASPVRQCTPFLTEKNHFNKSYLPILGGRSTFRIAWQGLICNLGGLVCETTPK